MLVDLLDQWSPQRKGARVLLVIDVSGSMKDEPRPTAPRRKLDLAKRAAIESLDEFKPDDQVGLRVFSTDLGPENDGHLPRPRAHRADLANLRAARVADRRPDPDPGHARSTT